MLRWSEHDPFYNYEDYIYCVKCYPFTTYKTDDKLEIDLSSTECWKPISYKFDDVDVVRKFLSPTELSNVVSASSRLQSFVSEAQQGRSTEGECLILEGNMQNWKYERLLFNKYTGNFSYESKK